MQHDGAVLRVRAVREEERKVTLQVLLDTFCAVRVEEWSVDQKMTMSKEKLIPRTF